MSELRPWGALASHVTYYVDVTGWFRPNVLQQTGTDMAMDASGRCIPPLVLFLGVITARRAREIPRKQIGSF